MTACAFHSQRPLQTVCVAAIASQGLMRSDQLKAGLMQMVEGVFPAALIVAGGAVAAVATQVSIVTGMAADAGIRQGFIVPWIHMAVLAAEQHVGILEDESCAFAVVETALGPGVRVVAVCAGTAAGSLVHVVVAMTIHALAGGRFELLIVVAAKAGGILMAADERKISGAVIEVGYRPAGTFVAVGTFAAEERGMNIILFVAVHAGGWCLGKGISFGVAAGAVFCGVGARQVEVGEGVVE